MAECHPVGFQWVVEARERGATVIHVDPRFSRTSALADVHVPIRAGSDIVFLGAIVRHILENRLHFHDYVVRYTNAATLIDTRYQDTEDLGGLFSGFDAVRGTYDPATWQYQGGPVAAAAGRRQVPSAPDGTPAHRPGDAPSDPTLEDPDCVFQRLRRHFQRYTPELVEQSCGIPRDLFTRVADTICRNSGRERTAAFCYAVGWTQHTVGVQCIRTAAIIQLLLGNVGRPGGGILALRGHASIQGSTDVPTLYDLLPGYLPMPRAGRDATLAEYVRDNASPTGGWGRMEEYAVSLMKAWWGDRATADNDWGFGRLPRISGDHSAYAFTVGMLEGSVHGLFLLGENPAVGSANGRLNRMALAALDWLVVCDLFETESASFWYASPEVESGELRAESVGTEVFLMPAAAHTEKDGTFTNTQRLLQWHHAAAAPRGDRRSDLWFIHRLGCLVRERLRGSGDVVDEPVQALTWDYPTEESTGGPRAEAVLAEISGFRVPQSPVVDAAARAPDAPGRTPLDSPLDLRADGSTACGCWIYCGSYAGGVNRPARRVPGSSQDAAARDWGWAWPGNRRLLYNRASADAAGHPWSERKRYVWWDASQRRWTGLDTPDFTATKPPDYRPEAGARGDEALAGDAPFVMQADGRGWLFAPSGLVDGPLPTHYEPQESPLRNPLYAQQSNPTRQQVAHRLNPWNQPPDVPDTSGVYPYVVTTYRLTEHHTAGAMSRTVANLADLQPELFCEVSPQLAEECGLRNGGWATIVTARAVIEARVLVTRRVPRMRLGDRTVDTVGLPYHWGYRGLSTGDAVNDLFPLALDPNVHIQEAKAATCAVRAGRRPRGPAARDLVEEYRGRAATARAPA